MKAALLTYTAVLELVKAGAPPSQIKPQAFSKFAAAFEKLYLKVSEPSFELILIPVQQCDKLELSKAEADLNNLLLTSSRAHSLSPTEDDKRQRLRELGKAFQTFLAEALTAHETFLTALAELLGGFLPELQVPRDLSADRLGLLRVDEPAGELDAQAKTRFDVSAVVF